MLRPVLFGVASACLLLLAANHLAAQEQTQSTAQTLGPAKRALIKEFLEVTEARKNVAALYDSMIEAEEKQLAGLIWESVSSTKEVKQLSASQQLALKKQLAQDAARQGQRMRELFTRKFDLGQMLEEISYVLYDKYFNEDELKDLIAFYRSPTGKKTVSVMPALFSESMSQTIEAIKPRLNELIAEFTAEESRRVKSTLPPPKTKPASKTTSQKRR